MRYAGWTLTLLFWLLVAAFLHYTLPQKDIVRIVETFEKRQELNDWTRIFWTRPDQQSDALINRDVQFIQTVRANGEPMVYRNEDTGWSWPPYFKFDTNNLYTEAADRISTRDDPQWLVITHYGWRNELWTTFPNATHIRPVSGPDVSKGVPWTNLIILSLLGFVLLALRIRWRRFRRQRLDPTLARLQDRWEATEDAVGEQRGRLRRLLGFRQR